MISLCCEVRAKVVDTRLGQDYRWRQYKCPCGERFTTSEMIDNAPDPRLKPKERQKCTG